jgi:hypothetical protein
MPIPRDHLPLCEGRGPDGNTVEFFVNLDELNSIRDNGPEWKFDDARFLYEAVQKPDAIFLGLQRTNQADSLCYSVQLTHDPDDEGKSWAGGIPPKVGFVFLAFVTLGQMGYLVFDWEWREEDPDEPGHPVGWLDDFKERIWPKP